jgi:ABC-type multidrug transport system fused ATPase/permease subunit
VGHHPLRRPETTRRIARALVKDPKILILDDATSSVDAETEKSIQEALRSTLRESSGRTTFIVAHRLSTILLADRIVVLERGACRSRHARRAPAQARSLPRTLRRRETRREGVRVRRLKSYLLRFPLLRLLAFAAPYKARLWVLGLVAVLATATSLSEPLIIGYAIDKGLVAGSLSVVYWMVALYVGVNVATWGLSYAQTFGMGWVGQSVILDIRNALFGHLQSLSLKFYSEQKAGWIISRLTNDIENFNNLLNDGVQNLVKNGLTLIGVFIAIFFVDWRVALAVTTILPVMILGTAVFRVQSWKAFRQAREAMAEVVAHLQENVSGMRVVQAFTREERSKDQFEGRNRAYRRANARASLLSAVYFPGVELLGSVGLGVVLLYGGFRVVGGAMTVGELVAFVGLLNMFFQPIQQLSQLYSNLQSTLVSLEKVFAVLDTEPDRADLPDAKELDELRGDLEFDGVSFAYGEDKVLEDVGFRIRPGETLAIVGETGAGKSTIVKLLSRFYDPTDGEVRVDGHDLREVRGSSLRRHMGVVLQDTFLFTGTIGDNIRYSRYRTPGPHRE